MRLTLAEAAQRLGKSERQLRYKIEQGQITATKRGGRWFLESEDLPLSEGQRQAVARKEQKLRAAVEDSLGLEKAKKRYSVRDLKAFQIALPTYQRCLEALGNEHTASRALHRTLDLLSRGCHRFDSAEKAAAYREARDAASTAVCELVLSGGEAGERLANEIEQELMAAIAGLLRRVEGKKRR